MRGRMLTILDETEGRVLQRMEKTIVDTFPDLQDPAKRSDLEKRLHATCDRVTGTALHDFDTLFVKDVNRLQDVIFKFDVSDKEISTVDLQKKFLHLWLQLLDQEIMKI